MSTPPGNTANIRGERKIKIRKVEDDSFSGDVSEKWAYDGVVLGSSISSPIKGDGRPAPAVTRANARTEMLPGEAGIFIAAVIEVETGALNLKTREVWEQSFLREAFGEDDIEPVETYK